MTYGNARKVAGLGAMPLIILSFLSAPLFAQDKIKGMIKARSGNTLMLENNDQPYINVVLQDTTTVEQNQGLLKARKKEMSITALIPGLQISAEGRHDENGMFVAKSITFNGNDLERAYSIQAGLSETDARSKANQEASAQHAAELEKQNEALKAQNAALQKQQAELAEHEKKIAANKALIEANTARFGQLDDYYIYDEVTVLFANGKTNVDSKYIAPLNNLAEKAITVEGYMVQVKGYASASGSAALNQKLSQERASAVSDSPPSAESCASVTNARPRRDGRGRGEGGGQAG